MLPRSVRVGTIYTSTVEVRDRSRPAHGAFYSTISLPGLVYKTLSLVGKGLKYSQHRCIGTRTLPRTHGANHLPTSLQARISARLRAEKPVSARHRSPTGRL